MEISERVTALEVASRYETRARDQDRQIIMAHSQRLHHAEASIHGILANGSKRDLRLGKLEVVAHEARVYRDRILFAKAIAKYMFAAIIVGLYLTGRLSGEQLEVIRAYFGVS